MTENAHRIIDLRSDTVTVPTDAMWEAMRNAEVGDDCYDEDPTANRLQVMAAEKVGKEAALFVTSGSMGNLCAVLAHTTPGQEVILGDKTHLFLWEVGSISRIAGCVTHAVPLHDGSLDPTEVEEAIRPNNIHAAQTGLICVENPSNRGEGVIIPPEHLARLAEVAKLHDIPMHMDGARIFNAAVGLGVDVREFTEHVDSIMFCLSKGLSAPIGSIVAGNRAFVQRAKRARKLLGGGWRQAGVIAAAGIVALEKGIDRLAEDHANARELAEGLVEMFPGCVDLKKVQTNLVYIHTGTFGMTGQEVVDRLAAYRVHFRASDPYRVRLVTHRWISSEDIDYTLEAFDRALRSS